MPTYQYACTACGEQLEAVQSFTDAALTECPACGGALRKVFSAVGVVFKGSGFYKTDSRTTAKSDSGKSDGAGGGGKADGGKGDTSKSDSGKTESAKPAAAAASSGTSTSTSSTPAAKSA